MEHQARQNPPALRASDEDRERVASILRNGYSHGRLDLDELQQRLDAAYAAKTLVELEHLTADLPSSTAAPSPDGPPAAPTLGGDPNRARRVRDRVLTYLVLMLFLVLIWAVTGAGPSFWPKWPIIVGALILALDLLGVERRRGTGRALSRDERRRLRDERGRGHRR